MNRAPCGGIVLEIAPQALQVKDELIEHRLGRHHPQRGGRCAFGGRLQLSSAIHGGGAASVSGGCRCHGQDMRNSSIGHATTTIILGKSRSSLCRLSLVPAGLAAWCIYQPAGTLRTPKRW